ncbi:MAG: histidine phosphatase family protein [Brevefilum sp.]|nr:histidine phosphatase family protein [Brevefilum sp.]
MTTILLVRHGQNDMVGKKLAGRLPGVNLNEHGKAQARRLAAALASLPLKAVISSPLERAQQTAEPIARIHNLPVEINSGLQEIDYGTWQGKSIKQLRRTKSWKVVQEQPSTFRFPEGETFAAAQSRIADTLRTLSAAYAEKDWIVCVGHCDMIRLAVAFFLEMPLDAFQRLQIDPASVTVLRLQDGHASFGPINAPVGFHLFFD